MSGHAELCSYSSSFTAFPCCPSVNVYFCVKKLVAYIEENGQEEEALASGESSTVPFDCLVLL